MTLFTYFLFLTHPLIYIIVFIFFIQDINDVTYLKKKTTVITIFFNFIFYLLKNKHRGTKCFFLINI